MKKAFTLAEIMIVLSIVGVLSAILIPAAFQASPDEAVLKFKKANSTIGSVIRELVYSEKYYKSGDLGTKKDGNAVNTDTYFCESFADIVAYKTINCSAKAGGTGYRLLTGNLANDKADFDTQCTKSPIAQIVTTDGITWYEANNAERFSKVVAVSGVNKRYFADPNDNAAPYNADTNGFDKAYKVICFDVDGLGTGTPAFGYGVRADGKILTGKNADDYIIKSVQRGG